MKHKSSTMLALSGLALASLLTFGTSSASAQSVYVERYVEPYPIVEPYPVVVAPQYVVRPAVVPRPFVHERTIVVSPPRYVSGPLFAPMPPRYEVADW